MTPLGLRPAQSDAKAATLVLIGTGLSVCLWMISAGSLGAWPLITVALGFIGGILMDPKVLRRTPLDLPLALFLATSVMAVGTAYDPGAARHKFWLILGGCLLAYAIAIQASGRLWPTAITLASLGFLATLVFLLLAIWPTPPWPFASIQLWAQYLRLAPSVSPATGVPSNVFGSFIALLFPFQLATFWRARQQGKRSLQMLFAVMLALAGLALVLVSERSILLALAGSLALWLLWRRFGHGLLVDRHYRRLLLAILIFAIFAATLVLFGGARWQALATIDRLVGAGSIIDRAQLFSQTLDLIGDFLLTGGGLASFPGLHARYILGSPFFFLPNAHNIILDVALEQGLLGILAFALLVAIAIWHLPALVASSSEANFVVQRSLLAGAALCSLLVLLTHGIVEDTTYGGAALPLLFIVPALTAALDQGNGDADRRHVWRWDKNTGMVAGAAILILLGITFTPSGRARWQANLGAMHMSRAELRDFPTERWVEPPLDGELLKAERWFGASLGLDANQRTARYRLGLIAMQRHDYVRAIDHLQVAYAQDPYHVGIRKALGYSYAWAGDLEKAGGLLASAPFISQELDAYITWWREHQRPDLAESAAQIRALLQTNDYQTVNE